MVVLNQKTSSQNCPESKNDYRSSALSLERKSVFTLKGVFSKNNSSFSAYIGGMNLAFTVLLKALLSHTLK